MKRSAPVLLFLSIALMGCVSNPGEPLEEKHSPRLGVALNSDGVASMSWESSTSYLYTIYFQETRRTDKAKKRSRRTENEAEEVLQGFLHPDQKGDSWHVLRSVRQVRGTGGTMTASDRVNPYRGIIRRYRLHFEKSPSTKSF